MGKEERFELVMDIVKRSDEMGLLMFDRISLSMDVKLTDDEFNLRLNELLEADNFNFSHDIIGIQQNINRQGRKMTGLFVPRYASTNQ